MTVTIGGLGSFPSSCTSVTILLILSSVTSPRTGLCPNSPTINSAVSASILWFTVTLTFLPNKYLMTELAFSAILLANS